MLVIISNKCRDFRRTTADTNEVADGRL